MWNWLRQAEQHVEPGRLAWERIENSIARGTPDVHACYRCVAFLCELKAVARPASREINCELRNDQALKLRAWWRAGGLSWVLIQVGVGAQAVRYLIPGSESHRLTMPIDETSLENMSAMPLSATPLEVLRCMSEK